MSDDNNMSGKDLRDKLRSATVGSAAVFKSKIVEADEVRIEVREPTVEGWGEILEHARKTNEQGEDEGIDFVEYLIWSVICCSFVPGTDIKVFEDADYSVLKKKPRSGFVGEFFDIASDLMKVDTEQAAKNLRVTAGDVKS